MILEHEQWCFGYDQILKDCRPSTDHDGSVVVSKTVLLLCSADVDAMASARILSYMLRSDGVRYVLLPCFGYRDFESKLEDMVNGGSMDDVGAMVLFNFGASRNLHKLYQKHDILGTRNNNGGGIKIYVMDCRRPVHLANVYSPSSVVVFLDSTQDPKDMPSDGDNLSGDDSTSDESSSSSDSDEEDSDSDGEDNDHGDNDDDDDHAEEEANFDDVVGESAGPSESAAAEGASHDGTRDPSYDAEDEREGEGNDEDAGDSDARGTDDADNAGEGSSSDRAAKRRKTDTDPHEDSTPDATPDAVAAPGLSPRERHAHRRNRVRKYYSDGGFYGSPSSFVAYALASSNRYGEDGDLLWLACVGVTDAYLHARLDLIGYAKLAGELTDRCRKLYPNDAFDRALSTVYAEDLDTTRRRGGNRSSLASMGTKTKIALSENGRIVSEKDFRFFLLKHCSLLESMQYSDYVCTRMKLYTKRGEQQLLELLAKMGYPLDECQQPFPFMRPSLRRRLKEKLGTHAQVRLVLSVFHARAFGHSCLR